MKVLGIIAEYNPFHLGHLYHIKKSKELVQPDFTIAVMSGNFTQRGEAAIVDKWIRAETAIKNGIDLVLELPVVYAVQTAELFAYGGIQVLNHTGLTTHVSFGSEIGDLAPLKRVANVLVSEDEAFKGLLKGYLQQGLSFPTARYRALVAYLQPTNQVDQEWNKVLASSNSILAIEYLKALKRTKSTILPITIPRINSAYHSPKLKKGISSATSIRNEILNHGLSEKVREAVPSATFDILSKAFSENNGPVGNHSLEDLLLGIIRRSSLSEISTWLDVNEGLENRIKDSAMSATNLSDLLSSIKTKRYVHTRLQRILTHGLLNLTTEKFSTLNTGNGPKYIRILAFSTKAAELMKKLKETSIVPVLTKAAHSSRYEQQLQEMFAFDCLATDLYSLGVNNPLLRTGGRDFTQGIFML